MKSMFFTKVTAVVVLIAAMGLVGAGGLIYRNQAAEPTKVSLDDVLSAWRKRDARVHSLSFAWDVLQFTAGAFQNRLDVLDLNGRQGPPEPDRSFAINRRFVSDGRGRMRFEECGPTWSARQAAIIPKTSARIFDGHREQILIEHGELDFPSANFRKGTAKQSYNGQAFFPLLLVYRAVHDAIGVVETKSLVVEKKTEIVNKHVIVVLTDRHRVAVDPTRDIVRSVWVDPARDFVPVQYTESIDGSVRTFVKIDYSKDAELGWVPQSWTMILTNEKGETDRSEEAKVTKYSINRELPESEFTLNLPTGTWVSDRDTKEDYILRANGKRRPILPGEFNGANYEQLLHSEPTKRPIKPPTKRRKVQQKCGPT